MQKRIKLMADYYASPLWWVDSEKEYNIDLSTLPLSEETVSRLILWAEDYNATLNQDDPATSGFLSDKDLERFEQEGINIWKQLRKGLAPAYTVWYFSKLQRKVLQHPDELL